MGIARRWGDAEVRDRDGNVLARPKANVWRTGVSSPGPGGEVYDYAGACTPDAAVALVGHQNRLLSLRGDLWRVVDATEYATLGYVDLTLIQVKADG